MTAAAHLAGQTGVDCRPVVIQRLDSVVNYSREGQTDNYSPVDIFIYYFDGIDKYPVIDRLSLPERTPVNRQNYYYSDLGTKSHYILKEWNGSDFSNRSRTDYSYRPDGRLAGELFSGFDGSTWLPYQQHLYNYDDDNIIRTYLRQMMYTPDTWTDFSYKNYIYDDQGRLIERNEQRIADGVIFWVELFTYDDRDRVATRIRQTLKYLPAPRAYALVNLNRQTYSYDNFGDLSGYLIDTWSNNEWMLTGKSVYYRSLLLYKIVPVCYKGVTRLVPVKVAVRLLSQGGLLGSCECLFPDGKKEEAKSSEYLPAIKLEESSVTVYPNPASSWITVLIEATNEKYSDVSIYYQSGSLITRDVIDGPSLTMDISSLKPGSYYMVFTGSSGQYTTTFIKKR